MVTVVNPNYGYCPATTVLYYCPTGVWLPFDPTVGTILPMRPQYWHHLAHEATVLAPSCP